MIFNIQRFSTHDGQGIRTMVFFKGCPLRCRWCCNPESQSFQPELLYDARRCRNFGDCLKPVDSIVTTAPSGIRINRSLASDLTGYRDVCASKALTVSGEEKSTGEMMEAIEKDTPFYSNGGGVTLSGGEPLSQDDHLVDLLTALKKKKLDVAVETSLHVAWEKIERCIGLVDTFLADLKHIDPEKFTGFTGGQAGLVMDNLRKLAAYQVHLIIRIPVIPTFNHTLAEMKRIIDFAATLGYVREIHFLPFHNLGAEKYTMLGMENPFTGHQHVEAAALNDYADYAASLGFITKIGG
jgi:pyruvate formate lyase activating enzyme